MASTESTAELIRALNGSGLLADDTITLLTSIGSSKINDTYMADTANGCQYFVKHHIADADMDQQSCIKMFEAEVAGLNSLRQTGAFRVPRPLGVGPVSDGAFLVTEFIQLQPLSDQRRFGQALAAMHLAKGQDKFGFHMNNFIGTTPQPNSWNESWADFLYMRLKFQFDQAPFPEKAQKQAERLLANLPTFFQDIPNIVPSMIHGDLWSGNCATDENGEPVVYDPAVYWGHNESELGIMRLFGRFSDELYEAYHALIPKAPGFDKRAPIYELYHLVNHLNMFGVAYLDRCTRLLQIICDQLAQDKAN
ncbi:hypothetical protein GGI19_000445 [Coemansia pectinata]|uniref:protein-ribulosamine 3-kinase n=1 Tax=Coemansia pectinata TaxID=1052879 RepID=A0A9W8GZD3_9FUNG|nr:hypothetical protein GGI19_000445 [Coemansia pectinata]